MRPDDPTFLTREDRRLPGVRRLLQVPTPAAGADWLATVPGGRQWRILAGRWRLVTSAIVANRSPGTQIQVDGIPIFENLLQSSLAASSTADLSSIDNSVNAVGQWVGSKWLAYIPGIWLSPGMAIGSETVLMDVGDQYSNIRLYIEECYADNTQLSEAHLERQAEERALAEHSQAILIGG